MSVATRRAAASAGAARLNASSRDAALQDVERRRDLHVARVLELRHRLESAGRARVAHHEDGIAVARPRAAPAEIARGLERLAGRVVHAVHREVEVVARIGEVVVVPAEEPHPELGYQDESHVAVAPVGVGGVLRAFVQGHDLHADARVPRGGRESLAERVDRLVAGAGQRLVARHAAERAVHPGRDVHDREELLDEQPGHAALVGGGRGVKPRGIEVLARPHHAARVLARAVVVRQDEPVRGDERGRAVGREAERAEPGAR